MKRGEIFENEEGEKFAFVRYEDKAIYEKGFCVGFVKDGIAIGKMVKKDGTWTKNSPDCVVHLD